MKIYFLCTVDSRKNPIFQKSALNNGKKKIKNFILLVISKPFSPQFSSCIDNFVILQYFCYKRSVIL